MMTCADCCAWVCAWVVTCCCCRVGAVELADADPGAAVRVRVSGQPVSASSTNSEEVTARERRMREVDFKVGINNHIVRVGRSGWFFVGEWARGARGWCGC